MEVRGAQAWGPALLGGGAAGNTLVFVLSGTNPPSPAGIVLISSGGLGPGYGELCTPYLASPIQLQPGPRPP